MGIWLMYGVMPPLNIFLERHGGKEGDDQPAKPCLWIETRDGLQIHSEVSRDKSTEEGEVSLFFRLPVVAVQAQTQGQDPAGNGATPSSSAEIWNLQIVQKLSADDIEKLVPCLQAAGDSITFEELVCYHNPPNAKVLLEHTRRNRTLFEATPSSSSSLNRERVKALKTHRKTQNTFSICSIQ